MENFENVGDNSQENAEVGNNQEQIPQGQSVAQDTQAEKDWKAEYDKRDKSYAELQKLYGKSSSELGALRKFKQENEPYINYLREQEKQQKYANDPQAEIKDWVQQQLQPVYEQRTELETAQTVSQLQQELGEEYKTLAPIMANVLKFYQEENPQWADYLARNPIALVRQAAGDLYLHNYTNQKKQAVQTQQVKQSSAKQMAGTARSSVAGNKQSTDMGTMDMNQMREHLRRMGAALQSND